MKDALRSAFDAKTFREQGHALVDLLANYLETTQTGQHSSVAEWTDPEQQLAYWKADFQKPVNHDPIPLLEDILQKSIHLHHPHYVGHQVAPPLPLSALTGIFTSLLNNGMAVYEMGMVSSALERIVTDWLAGYIGFSKEATGVLTSGGTLATLTALLAARSAKAPGDVWEQGSGAKLAVMVSEEAHYCVDRAVRVMGLGNDGIIKIPVSNELRMRTDLLESYYTQAQERGITVFAIVGSACTTSTGSYDALEVIADFCKRHNCWFHVDGAHGGAVVVSDTYKPLVKGIEHADSVAIDFHKMLMMPALITALIFKKEAHSYQTFQQKAQYLWSNQHSRDWFNLGKRTFECTKIMMSVKVYTALRTYGSQLFAENVDTLYNLARRFAKLVKQRPAFELAIEPEANIVCFRYIPNKINPEQWNEFNSGIRQAMLKEGRFYLVQTTVRGITYLRVTLMNPLTTLEHLADMLDSIEQKALQA